LSVWLKFANNYVLHMSTLHDCKNGNGFPQRPSCLGGHVVSHIDIIFSLILLDHLDEC